MTRETDYFKTFCRVSNAFGTTLGKQEILELIVQSAIETMDGKAACLFLADEESDVFVPVAQRGLSENYLHASPMHARKVVQNLLQGGYLSIYDATADPRLENHAEKKAEGITSILVVPVLVSGKAIGVLSLYSASPRDFSGREVEFLTALAEQGGMAIQRSRLFDRIQENARLFYDLATTLNSSLDIKKILHILTAVVSDAFGMKGAEIRLVNKDTGSLDLVASYGLSEEYLRKSAVSHSLCVTPVIDGNTVVITDVANDSRLQCRETTLKEGIATILCAPIKSGEEIIGVLKLCSPVQRDFPEDVVTLVNALAHSGGLAIENASLYLMLQEDKKHLEQDIWSHKSWF
jgi:GAF domain-containing protein